MAVSAPHHKPYKAKAIKHYSPKMRKQGREQSRDRQQSRALFTSSRAWRSIRARILVRDLYTCKMCKGIANEVDHIDGDAYNNLDDNLQSLCKPCHSSKTAKEMANNIRGMGR